MKTPISYYGGKARIASQIVPHIWAIPHTVYAEPFAGGLSVLYAKGLCDRGNNDNYREVVNDLNKCLTIFWRVAREFPDQLTQWIRFTPYSQEDHRASRAIYQKPENYSDLKIAWAVYVLCNQSFSKALDKSWSTCTQGQNVGSVFANRTKAMPECFYRLRNVIIGCEDALEFINRWDSPQTLFYCDPPYPNADQGHYKGYSNANFQMLCDRLDKCQGSYILSNYDQDCAPKGAQQQIKIKATMTAARSNRQRPDRTENLWICDRSEGIESNLKAIAKMEVVRQTNLLEVFS